jgi:hypothetical protein
MPTAAARAGSNKYLLIVSPSSPELVENRPGAEGITTPEEDVESVFVS